MHEPTPEQVEAVRAEIQAWIGMRGRFRASNYVPPHHRRPRILWPAQSDRYTAQREGKALEVDPAGFAELVKSKIVKVTGRACCPSRRIFALEK